MSSDHEAPRTGNWGRWGVGDERGAANHLDNAHVLEALTLPQTGEVVSLALPLKQYGLPVFDGRPPVVHLMALDGGDYHAGACLPDGAKFAYDYVFLPCHAATHIDALSHAWEGDQLYNGFPDREVRSSGAQRLGIEKLGGLVGRGVLLDVPAALGRALAPGEAITPEQVVQTLECQGTELRRGDTVLVRTGWLAAWQAAGEDERRALMRAQAGLSVATAPLWTDADVTAVGADNCGLEAMPDPDGGELPLHRRLLHEHGIYILELLDLEALAARQAYEFLFIGAPLAIRGATGSPLTPLAVL